MHGDIDDHNSRRAELSRTFTVVNSAPASEASANSVRWPGGLEEPASETTGTDRKFSMPLIHLRVGLVPLPELSPHTRISAEIFEVLSTQAAGPGIGHAGLDVCCRRP